MGSASKYLAPMVSAVLLLASGHGVRAAPSFKATQLSPCAGGNPIDGLLCGAFVVPEDRANPDRRRLRLDVKVLEATGDRPREPVFFLTGGPGQAATDAAASFADSPLRREHEIVLMDLRGTSAGVALDCVFDDAHDLQADLDPLFHDLTPYAPCAASLSKRANLSLYTTPIAMQDLDELRRAFEYDLIDLYGASYGSRAGLVYLRMFDKHVHAAVFSGMAAMENTAPLYHAAAAERALERLFAQCAEQPACRRAYPDPLSDVRAVIAHLDTSPERLTVKHPASGASVQVTLTAAGFTNGLRVMLYSEEGGREIPRLLSAARAGSYQPFAAAAVQAGYEFNHGIHLGLMLSATCSEDVARIRAEDVPAATSGSVFGDWRVRGQMTACALWPKGRLPTDYAAPFTSSVPTLILSGELDPVTPPHWGEIARKTLTNSRHIILPGAHVSGGSCVRSMVRQMFETADPAAVDAACVRMIALPPFDDPGALISQQDGAAPPQ